MKSVLFRNLVLLIIVMLWGRVRRQQQQQQQIIIITIQDVQMVFPLLIYTIVSL